MLNACPRHLAERLTSCGHPGTNDLGALADCETTTAENLVAAANHTVAATCAAKPTQGQDKTLDDCMWFEQHPPLHLLRDVAMYGLIVQLLLNDGPNDNISWGN